LLFLKSRIRGMVLFRPVQEPAYGEARRELPPPGGGPTLARTYAPRRAHDRGSDASGAADAEANRGAFRAGRRGESFPGCNALKSHETGLESADWSYPSRHLRRGESP
jgi:hypothetical protein